MEREHMQSIGIIRLRASRRYSSASVNAFLFKVFNVAECIYAVNKKPVFWAVSCNILSSHHKILLASLFCLMFLYVADARSARYSYSIEVYRITVKCIMFIHAEQMSFRFAKPKRHRMHFFFAAQLGIKNVFSCPAAQVRDSSNPVVSTLAQIVQRFGLRWAPISSPDHIISFSIMVNKSSGGTKELCTYSLWFLSSRLSIAAVPDHSVILLMLSMACCFRRHVSTNNVAPLALARASVSPLSSASAGISLLLPGPSWLEYFHFSLTPSP